MTAAVAPAGHPRGRRICWDPEQTTGVCACPDKVRLYSTDGHRRLLIPCKRRLCSHCGPHHWRPPVLAGLHAGLRQDQTEYLAVLLTAPGDIDAETFNADASRRWHHFVTLLRRRYPGADLQFWRVAELQERGHVHFHFVLRGLRFLALSDSTDPVTGRHLPGLRSMALQAGFGRFVGVRRPRDYPGGVRSLGYYFGKYLLKRYQTDVGVTKLVTFSHRWRVHWATRSPEGGRWMYGGPVGAPFTAFGHVIEAAREARAADPPWRPPWHRHHWSYYRGREELPIDMPLQWDS